MTKKFTKQRIYATFVRGREMVAIPGRAIVVALAVAIQVCVLGGCSANPPAPPSTDPHAAAPVAASAPDGQTLGATYALCGPGGLSEMPNRGMVFDGVTGWAEIVSPTMDKVRDDWVDRAVYRVTANLLKGDTGVSEEISLTPTTRDAVAKLVSEGTHVYFATGGANKAEANPAELIIAVTTEGAAFFVGDCREWAWRTVRPNDPSSRVLTDAQVASIVGASVDQLMALYNPDGPSGSPEPRSSTPVFRDSETLTADEVKSLVPITVVVSVPPVDADPVALCSSTPDAVNECALLDPRVNAQGGVPGISFSAWAKPGQTLTFFVEPADATDGIAGNTVLEISVPSTLAAKEDRYVLLEADFSHLRTVSAGPDGEVVTAPAVQAKSELVPLADAQHWPELFPAGGGEPIVDGNV